MVIVIDKIGPTSGNQGNSDLDSPTRLSTLPVSVTLGVIGLSGRTS